MWLFLLLSLPLSFALTQKCHGDSFQSSDGSKCFLIVPGNMTYNGALSESQKVASTHCPNGGVSHLTVIKGQTDIDLFKSKTLTGNDRSGVWIGATRDKEDWQEWSWIDGTPVDLEMRKRLVKGDCVYFTGNYHSFYCDYNVLYGYAVEYTCNPTEEL
ncbi:hypothetical protein L596_016901 [Steinernema carpocapsae]|uniref:C-type lectin domain-containing protein n=1 Tax=Steinernema carpocapsae TaxID=34508 RepID=A0A4U5NKR0_STECR|nr:hypothetical protein L596_016901 [Steinernema carpocapsae]